jgi:hypothetical protein
VWEGAAAQESGGGIPGAAGLWGAAGPHHRVRHYESVRGQQPTAASGGHVHTAAGSRVRPPTGATAGEEWMPRVCVQGVQEGASRLSPGWRQATDGMLGFKMKVVRSSIIWYARISYSVAREARHLGPARRTCSCSMEKQCHLPLRFVQVG